MRAYMTNDKPIEQLRDRQPDGIGNKSNLRIGRLRQGLLATFAAMVTAARNTFRQSESQMA
jgi:hypothetical protein